MKNYENYIKTLTTSRGMLSTPTSPTLFTPITMLSAYHPTPPLRKRRWITFATRLKNTMMYKGKFAKYYDDIYGNKDYIGESKILEKYCNLDRVLDVGCGTGAHLRKLYKKGRVLHGLDVSEDMISIAKEKFKDNKDVSLYNLDVTTFEEMVDLPKFTTVISMFNVVNHVLHRQQIGGFFRGEMISLLGPAFFRFLLQYKDLFFEWFRGLRIMIIFEEQNDRFGSQKLDILRISL